MVAIILELILGSLYSVVFWTDRQLCFSDGRFSCSLAPCRLEERRIQSWWVCNSPWGTLLFVGQSGGMLGGVSWIYPGSEESSQSENPLAEAYWDPSQKHDGLLVFAANVTLDAETAHPALLLSEEGRRVSWQETCQDLPSSPQRFTSLPCVLGQLHIISGRYFWEVEVGNPCSWDLGVCRDNVTRTGRVTVSPQNGFWAIRFYEGEYWALTSPETHLTLREKPFIVGVFLDYEAGDVSFYNMTDGSHIFTFPQNTFYGVLRPLFRLWSSDSGFLTICPGEGECADVVIHMSTPHEKWWLWSPIKFTIIPQWDTNRYFSYSLLVHSQDETLELMIAHWIRWHHQFNGHELGKTAGDCEGLGSLACFSLLGCEELDLTWWLKYSISILPSS